MEKEQREEARESNGGEWGPDDPVPNIPESEEELIDKESADSFPASDPPSH